MEIRFQLSQKKCLSILELTGALAYGNPRKASTPRFSFATPRRVPFLIVTCGLVEKASMGEANTVPIVSKPAKPTVPALILRM